MSATKEFAGRAGAAAQQGGKYLRSGYDYGQEALQRRSGSSIAWMIIGYSLLAILVYIAIADKPVVNAIGSLAGLGSSAIGAWVNPVDPISSLTGKLGLKEGTPPSTQAGSGSSSGSEHAPTSPPPSPNKIARAPLSKLPNRPRSMNTTRAVDRFYERLRREAVAKGTLHA